ncbi:MAG: GmrSD restriction endonuclease domain-containing protein, partial [Cetobacterium sp.]
IFYFDVSDDEKWLVIDGLQRLSTIKKFIVENKLKLSNLEFLAELNGKKYTDLDRNIQRVIDETQIITYQVEGQTPKEVRYSIFNRINTGGLTLNPQEIRQALNQQNNGVKYLKEIAEDKNFINIVRIASKRMVDRELILRYFSFKLKSYGEFYESKITLSTFLDNTMEYIDSKEFTDEKYRVLKTEFLDTLVYLTKLFEKNTLFNKTIVDKDKTATLNRSLFEIWTVLISGLSKEEKNRLLIKKILLKEKYKSLLKTLIFEDAITKGTNDRKAVFSRFSQLKSLLEEVAND